MMTEAQEIEEIETQFLKNLKENSGMAIAMGVIMLLVGLMAMAAPLAAGFSVALMVGSLLFVGGIAQLIFSFKNSMGIWSILFAVLTIIMGVYMLMSPEVALGGLTIFLATYLIVSGITEVIVFNEVRPAPGAGWGMFSGVLAVVLGGLIWSQFPLSGAWAIGILLGVRLFFNGMTLLMLGLSARNAV